MAFCVRQQIYSLSLLVSLGVLLVSIGNESRVSGQPITSSDTTLPFVIPITTLTPSKQLPPSSDSSTKDLPFNRSNSNNRSSGVAPPASGKHVNKETEDMDKDDLNETELAHDLSKKGGSPIGLMSTAHGMTAITSPLSSLSQSNVPIVPSAADVATAIANSTTSIAPQKSSTSSEAASSTLITSKSTGIPMVLSTSSVIPRMPSESGTSTVAMNMKTSASPPATLMTVLSTSAKLLATPTPTSLASGQTFSGIPLVAAATFPTVDSMTALSASHRDHKLISSITSHSDGFLPPAVLSAAATASTPVLTSTITTSNSDGIMKTNHKNNSNPSTSQAVPANNANRVEFTSVKILKTKSLTSQGSSTSVVSCLTLTSAALLAFLITLFTVV